MKTSECKVGMYVVCMCNNLFLAANNGDIGVIHYIHRNVYGPFEAMIRWVQPWRPSSIFGPLDMWFMTRVPCPKHRIEKMLGLKGSQ